MVWLLPRLFWGSHSDPAQSITVSTTQTNYDLFTAAGSPAYDVNITLTIEAGVTITGDPALSVGNFTPDSSITIVNNGIIMGDGGAGGQGGTGPHPNGKQGGTGKTAVDFSNDATLTNNGTIEGGTGGTGGTGATHNNVFDGKGYVCTFQSNGATGAVGATGGGAVGATGATGGGDCTPSGGKGGGAGGPAGAYLDYNGYNISFTNNGSVAGVLLT